MDEKLPYNNISYLCVCASFMMCVHLRAGIEEYAEGRCFNRLKIQSFIIIRYIKLYFSENVLFGFT